mgnify:CR=1 FL=1
MLKSKRQNLHDTSYLKFFEWVQIGIAVIQSNLNQKERHHVIKKNIENKKFTILVDTKCHHLQLPGLLKAEFLVMSICHPLTTKPAATKGVSSSR